MMPNRLLPNIKQSYMALACILCLGLGTACTTAYRPIERYTSERFVVKGANEELCGYEYVSFSSGAAHGNAEVFVSRGAMNHYTSKDPSEWGALVFTVRDPYGVSSAVADMDYSSFSGELRDPHIVWDSSHDVFLVSCFTTNEDNQHSAVIIAFDSGLHYKSHIEWDPGYIVWGKTLIDPEGHLLISAYDELKRSTVPVQILRSKEPFAGDASTLEFCLPKAIDCFAGCTETDLEYVGNTLVAVARVDDGDTLLARTSDLQGLNGWSAAYDLHKEIHSPMLLNQNESSKVICAGSLVKKVGFRVPILCEIDIENGAVCNLLEIDRDVFGYSGYPALIAYEGGLLACITRIMGIIQHPFS